MNPSQRVLASVAVGLVVSWTAFWICVFLIPVNHQPIMQWRISQLAALLCGLGAGAYTSAATVSASQQAIRCASLGALVTGAIAFLAGLIGPVIFLPRSNQGPLVAFLFTGPLGLIAGAIGGAAYGSRRNRRKPHFPSAS